MANAVHFKLSQLVRNPRIYRLLQSKHMLCCAHVLYIVDSWVNSSYADQICMGLKPFFSLEK